MASKSTPTTKTCLCSPTSHPGSFRCSIHRNNQPSPRRPTVRIASNRSWELAMMAKADAVRAFLLQIIKPSSLDLQRRRNFQPRPSRFGLMNANSNGVAVS